MAEGRHIEALTARMLIIRTLLVLALGSGSGAGALAQSTEAPPAQADDTSDVIGPAVLRLSIIGDRERLLDRVEAGGAPVLLALRPVRLAQANPRTGPAFGAPDPEPRWAVWGRLATRRQEITPGAQAFETAQISGSAGLERAMTDTITGGLSYTVTRSRSDLTGFGGAPAPRTQDSGEHLISAYLIGRRGPFYLTGAMGRGWGTADLSRSLGPGLGRARAETSLGRSFAQVQTGATHGAGRLGWQAGWQAGLIAATSQIDGYRDTAGARFADRSDTLAQATGGIVLAHTMVLGRGTLRPELRALYAYEIRRNTVFAGEDRGGLDLSGAIVRDHASGWRAMLRAGALLARADERRLAIAATLRRRF